MLVIEKIKASFFYSLIIKIKILMDNSYIFNFGHLRIKTKQYEWNESYSIYNRFFRGIDNLLCRLAAGINNFYSRSIFSEIVLFFKNILEGSWILNRLKAFSGFDSMGGLLIIIPTLYIFVDKIIRKTPFINRFGSIWDEAFLMIMILWLFCRKVNSKGKSRLEITPMDSSIFIFILVGICHIIIVQPNLNVAIEGFRAMFQQMFWFFVFTQIVKSKKNVLFIGELTSFMGLFLGLHACYQYVMKVPMLGNWADVAETIRTRAYSIVGSPNILGALFVILIPVSLAMIYNEKKPVLKTVHIVSTMSMIAGLLFTFSRGAWLGFAFVVFIFIVALNIRLLIPFGVLGSLFIVSGSNLSNRLLYVFSPQYIESSMGGGRMLRWSLGLDLWSRNKPFGVGLGRFGGAVAINNDLAPFYLDNYYLKTMVEMGIYGVIAMIFFIICFIIFSIRVIRAQNNIKDKILTTGLFTGAVGVLIQNCVENVFEVPAMMIIFFLYIALLNAMRKSAESKEQI